MRRLILKLLVIVVPVGLLIGFVNFFVDPANIFSNGSYCYGIAEILMKGHNVDNTINFDERLLQVKMISGVKRTPDVIILGSSRVWEIGSDFYPGKTVMSCGVPGATLDDLVGIIGLLDSLNHLPKEVVISLDPFLVCEHLNSDWGSLTEYHAHLLRKLNLPLDFSDPPARLRKLMNLFSLNYFKGSCEFLLLGKSKQYVDVGTARPTRYGKFYDGTIAYPEKFLHPDTALTSILAKDAGEESGIQKPDKKKMVLLGRMVNYLVKNNVKVKLLLIPYHPGYYQYVQTHQSDLFDQFDKEFHDMAKEQNLEVIGSFDPGQLGITISAFYDAYHLDKSHLQKLLMDSQ